MGKKAKSQRAQKRKMEKRARKEAKAALYKSYAEQGRQGGSKRMKLKAKNKLHVRSRAHLRTPCGNLGCPKCYPRLNMGFLVLMRINKWAGLQYQETTRYKHLVPAWIRKIASGKTNVDAKIPTERARHSNVAKLLRRTIHGHKEPARSSR